MGFLNQSAQPTHSPAAAIPSQKSGIGDALEQEFGRRCMIASQSCSCADLREKLNYMTAEQVREWSELPELIMQNFDKLDGLSGHLIRAMLLLPGGLSIAKNEIKKCINKAIEVSSKTTHNLTSTNIVDPQTWGRV